MKNNKKELDVDFIGGAEPLTKEEQKKISEFIKTSKDRLEKQKTKKNLALQKRKSVI